MKFSRLSVVLMLKGFFMGMADIVPGVSGGTVALVTGIYDRLLESISRFNRDFIRYLIQRNIKGALKHINISFLLPLGAGIFIAVVSMAKAMHFLMDHYPVYTWSLFFGLILASILFVARQIENLERTSHWPLIILGTGIGYAVVSLVPVETPDSLIMVFLSAMIAICAMILPGISGSFILLILGKYAFITAAIKAPFDPGSMIIILTFSLGAAVGLLSFSKLLNYFLKHYHNEVMCLLVGFMLGSVKKIWPWREVISQKVVRGKVKVLEDAVIWPASFGLEELLAFGLIVFGIVLVFVIESFSQQR